MAEKSLLVAYICWLFGGVFGLHHLYLGRDIQAFLTWSTLGGYVGFGWLRDFVRIPEYVRDANEDKKFIQDFVHKLKTNEKPPFSCVRFMAMVVVSYIWSSVWWSAIPEDELFGINFRPLIYLSPVACALGVWAVGNVGREEGSIWWPLLAAVATIPVFWYFDESNWFTAMVFCSALAFDTKSKKWSRTPKQKKSTCKRFLILGGCVFVYCVLITSFLYFNGTVTTSDGEQVKVQEAIHHFFTSPWWVDLQQSLTDTWNFAQQHGWLEVWKQIIDLSDPQGEINAHRILGVSKTASQSEITARYRTLSKESHPDKFKDPVERAAAQERFMEIQQAYDVLSKMRSKRTSKNKKSVTE